MELNAAQVEALNEYLDDSDASYFTDEELAETTAERLARLKAAKTPKGTCPKCQKHIGKGIAFHIKACEV